jgi:hypothetical protein
LIVVSAIAEVVITVAAANTAGAEQACEEWIAWFFLL